MASLVAAPDFFTSKVAIAGGFRSGIYHTNDDGGHWDLVLTKPSSILQGSNEVYDIAFLSPTAVSVINGGELIWQEF